MLVTSAAFIVILALLPFHFSGSADAYSWMLYIGGFMITNRAFNEMHDHRKACAYLTLPCSNLERFLSKFLLTTVIFAIVLLVVFYACSMLSVITNTLFFHHAINIFDLTSIGLWIGIGKYIVLQSIFLLGAAYFQKHSITKTTLALGCLFIVLAILLFLFSWVTCPSCSQSGLFDLISKSFNGVYFIFWIVVAPICWLITYVRIAESEIK
ncbi:MAG: hypothetical protein A3E53_01190 [Gammaproteobacteria bacterium RIFCSPHIGHO2_12_FULL_39_24]|nr:MAG: hypothetical protein A3E53_01190 [Gammaproteobacteria bacterium RIFCSPHIGHO2_12_FULL_39_24]